MISKIVKIYKEYKKRECKHEYNLIYARYLTNKERRSVAKDLNFEELWLAIMPIRREVMFECSKCGKIIEGERSAVVMGAGSLTYSFGKKYSLRDVDYRDVM
jgi:hypothetical protein